MITDEDILDIAEQAADQWWELACQLPLVGGEGHAFRQSGQFLRNIKTQPKSDEKRLIKVLLEWRITDPRHRWGFLWDTLLKCGLRAVADNVLKRSGE